MNSSIQANKFIKKQKQRLGNRVDEYRCLFSPLFNPYLFETERDNGSATQTKKKRNN